MGHVAILSVNEDDLYSKNFGLESLKILDPLGVNKAILDLSNVSILQNSNLKVIDDTVKLYGLNGIKAVACGFNTIAVCGFVHFMDDYHFQSFLDVDNALHAI